MTVITKSSYAENNTILKRVRYTHTNGLRKEQFMGPDGSKKFGSDLIVDVIKQYDIEYASINPGASFRGLHDSLINYGGNVKPEIITCLHENTAVGIAHG